MPMERPYWVITIQWDEDHASPPIGPFTSQAATKAAAAEIRKRLKANDRKWQGRVHTHMMSSMWRVRGWLPLEGDERLAGAVVPR